ncbi:ROK family transcriptional regulator [Actinotalea sp. M2MS4P-6]|uniref:ROK family transcriptional regulator n=1 Tax=Actinotalea sp. M2MS4P-6 TaxID=2983762 RepID=UPI0021E43523|nr:ROK family transcriptional regulator [Actinotalea sp. M2MS4P-6]MCV2394844.1 ROK family transcriptional regulator [Actinotalea sp. M2MS4P-6]
MVERRDSTLRDRTRDELFELIRTTPAITRARLAELTGVSRSTVNHAVGRLVDAGLVAEVPAVRSKASGRPGVGLAVAPSGGAVGGIDFGHGHIAVAVADAVGTVLGSEYRPMNVDLDAAGALDYAVDTLTRLAGAHTDRPLSLVVAGVPGPLDARTGEVRSPTILSGWVGRAPAQELADRLGAPVHVENDAVLGAYGERQLGAGRGHQDFLYVKASGGIGAGLMLGGSIYNGATGLAGEIGHTEVAGHTEPCRCGNRGCLEAVVSIDSLRAQIAHAHPGRDLAAPPVAHARPGGDMSAPHIGLGDLSDPITTRIINEAGRTLGRALAGMCNLLNPSAVIIGGLLGTAAPAFVDGVEASIRRRAQPATAAELSVLAAELGPRAELFGAIQLAAHRAPR